MSKPNGRRPTTISTKAKEPRQFDELQKLAGELTFQLGNAQYTMEVYRKEVEGLIESLESVNKEAAARKELDKATA